MKKIVLIQPPSPYLLEPLWKLPLTLCGLRTYLENLGHEVELIDLGEESVEPPWNIPFDADIYGLSIYTPQHCSSLRLAAFLRQNTDALIIAGGHHVSALKENYLVNSDFDALVIGEGEIALKEICEGKPFDKIKGIIFKENGTCRANGPARRLENLGFIPFPEYKQSNLARYKGNLNDEKKSSFHIGLITSRGCHFRCAFCASRLFWRQKVTWFPTDMIISHLDYLSALDVESIEFYDDNFVVHPGFKEICEHLGSLGISWSCMGRSDKITKEKANLMHKSGCFSVNLGIESGSDRILKIMEKSSSVDIHVRAINILKSADVPVKGLMIAGFPGENDNDAQLTEQFIKEQPVDKYTFCAFVPFPGTPVWHNPQKYNAIIDRSIPFEEYLLTSKDFNTRPILNDHQKTSKHLQRYLEAAGLRCTNTLAFIRAGKL